MRVHQDWDHPPKLCKSCKERKAAEWYETACADCGTSLRIHRDWDHPPKLCKSCKQKQADKWYEVSCKICHSSIRACRDWDKPPRHCKSCRDQCAPRSFSCDQCGKSSELTTGFQLKCKENGWTFPTRCEECKHDALLIKGAIGALRDEFRFALEATIEQRGFIFTDKVAVVRSKKTGEVVAEVKMTEKGIFSTTRIAVATRSDTGKIVGETRDGSRGVFFPKRTADTYQGGTRTHRTEAIDRGIILPKTSIETKREDGSRVARTTNKTKGIFFPKRTIETRDPEK